MDRFSILDIEGRFTHGLFCMRSGWPLLLKRLSATVVLLCATIFVSLSTPSLWAGQKEREVTEVLLDEGYTLQQATVEGLVEMIEQGYSWDQTDKWMAYHGLQRFAPFSEQSAMMVLDLIHRGAKTENTNVDVDRLMEYIFYDDNPIRTLRVVLKVQETMRLLKPSGAKRRTAFLLSSFASERPEAINCLRSLLKEFSDQPTLQVLTAYDLLKLGEHVEEASAVLERNLLNAETAKTVLFYASVAYFETVSDHLFEKMRTSLELFAEKDQRAERATLARIAEKRASSAAARCTHAVGGSETVIIPFRGRPKG